MLGITLTREVREGREQFKSFDIAQFSKRTFGMFAGEEEMLEIKFDNRLIGVIIDRFGKEVPIRKHDGESFIARLSVSISSQFYGWLAALGSGAKIISPKAAADGYADYLKNISTLYDD